MKRCICILISIMLILGQIPYVFAEKENVEINSIVETTQQEVSDEVDLSNYGIDKNDEISTDTSDDYAKEDEDETIAENISEEIPDSETEDQFVESNVSIQSNDNETIPTFDLDKTNTVWLKDAKLREISTEDGTHAMFMQEGNHVIGRGSNSGYDKIESPTSVAPLEFSVKNSMENSVYYTVWVKAYVETTAQDSL